MADKQVETKDQPDTDHEIWKNEPPTGRYYTAFLPIRAVGRPESKEKIEGQEQDGKSKNLQRKSQSTVQYTEGSHKLIKPLQHSKDSKGTPGGIEKVFETNRAPQRAGQEVFDRNCNAKHEKSKAVDEENYGHEGKKIYVQIVHHAVELNMLIITHG